MSNATYTRPPTSLVDGLAFETTGEEVPVIDPSSGEAYGTIHLAGMEDVDAAVAAAARAFSGGWRQSVPSERGRLMVRLAAAIREHFDELVEIEMRNTGHPRAFARADAENAARYFEFYGGIADKIHGETIPLGEDFIDFTIREPWGVCAVITPFNGPLQMLGRSGAPAIAAGNTVVLKASEQAPEATLALAAVLNDAGLPAGVMNVLPGGAEAGQQLVSHPDIAHVTFTGSVRTGTAIMQAAATQITPVTLELGGKSPQIVFADADLAAATQAIIGSAIVTAGQVCFAGTRILVEESVRLALADHLRAAIEQLSIGPPSSGADMGPLISGRQQERVLRAIRAAIDEGADLVVGGDEPVAGVPEGGYFVRPTVFDGLDAESRIAREEIFGPVLGVMPFETVDDAMRMANDTEFGLAAGVWTSDVSRALHFARGLQSGQVYVNTYGAGSGGGIELPFGGFKKSGIGREKGVGALHEYTQIKNVCVRTPTPQ